MILVCSNRFIKLEKTFFDEKWNRINLTEGEHDVNITLQKPYNFEKMKELAERLSKNMKFLRVDFYEVNRKIYFGELTFYPNSGYDKFIFIIIEDIDMIKCGIINYNNAINKIKKIGEVIQLK